jgi:hypothetical protein
VLDVTVAVNDATVAPDPNDTAAMSIAVTDVNEAPVLNNNHLTIAEGATVTLDTSMLSATDVDHPDPVLTFNVSGVTAGHFAFGDDTATPITSFDQGDIAAGNVVFVHDGSETAPGYSVSVTDGTDNTAFIPADITFSNQTGSSGPSDPYLTLGEAWTDSPNSSSQPVADQDQTDPSPNVNDSGVASEDLTVSSDAVKPITHLDLGDLADGSVIFVQNGSQPGPDNPASAAGSTDFGQTDLDRRDDTSLNSHTYFSYQKLRLLLTAQNFKELKTALTGLDIKILSSADYELVRNSLDAIKTEIGNEIRLGKTVLGSAIATTVGLSAGYVVWMLKGGSLLASVLSSLPAWQLADPLAILVGKRGDEDDDDESLETIIDDGSKRDEDKENKVSDLDNVTKESIKQ